MSRKLIWVCVLSAWCCASESQADPKYPRIAPLERVLDVPSVEKANVNVIIKSIQGRPAYKIQCHSSNYGAASGFDYSGDFECRMIPAEGATKYSTLFTEDPEQSRDWESRARFFSADLQGDCARIPEFGSTRDFKLRGMMVTLQVLQPAFDLNGVLDSLKLKINVRPYPSAQRPIAAAVPFPASPPSQCKIAQYFPSPSPLKPAEAR